MGKAVSNDYILLARPGAGWVTNHWCTFSSLFSWLIAFLLEPVKYSPDAGPPTAVLGFGCCVIECRALFCCLLHRVDLESLHGLAFV